MKFICVGLPKTGLMSIAHALKVLGYNVYKFHDQILYYMDEWLNLFNHGKVPDFYTMFKDVDVVVGAPSSFFFEELMEAFPETKVILSVRQDEDAWVRSVTNQHTIFKKSNLAKISYLLPTYNSFSKILISFRMAAFGTVDPSSTYIFLKRYRQHNDRVKSVVPADKLLVYSVDRGWKPLCDFTGKKIPDQPFPHLNIKGDAFYTFQTETELGRRITREANVLKLFSAVMVVVLGVFAVCCQAWI